MRGVVLIGVHTTLEFNMFTPFIKSIDLYSAWGGVVGGSDREGAPGSCDFVIAEPEIFDSAVQSLSLSDQFFPIDQES